MSKKESQIQVIGQYENQCKKKINKTSGGLYYFEDDTTVVTCLDGSSVVCNVGTVQQLHCFPIVSSQVLKVTLQEERWGGLMEEKKKFEKEKRTTEPETK